jgi:hypothetical protein
MQPGVEASVKTAATVLSRALEPKGGILPPEGAKFVLDLGIREEDNKRVLKLLARRQRGTITAGEAEELKSYIEADNILSILKAQALLASKTPAQKS